MLAALNGLKIDLICAALRRQAQVLAHEHAGLVLWHELNIPHKVVGHEKELDLVGADEPAVRILGRLTGQRQVPFSR